MSNPLPPRAADSDDERDEPRMMEEAPTAGAATRPQIEEVIAITASDELVEVNSSRIFSFDELPLDKMLGCTALVLRKNLLHALVPFPEHLRRNLTELDLFDNKLSQLEPFFLRVLPDSLPTLAAGAAIAPSPSITSCQFYALRKLDVSYNRIKRIAGLQDLPPTLEELYMVENMIKDVSGLETLVNLKILELGGNRIRSVGDGLRTLVNLEQLWLGKNKIADLGTAFHGLKKLKRLSLQANRLTRVDASTFPEGEHPVLEELFLGENGITVIDGLEHLHGLSMIDLSMNPVPTLGRPQLLSDDDKAKALSAGECTAMRTTILTPAVFPRLAEFWLSDGKLSDWRELGVFKPFVGTLDTVYLERNPLEDDQRYRAKIAYELPFLRQIDSWPVVNRDDPEKDRARRSAN